MLLPKFEYHDPDTLEEACGLLDSYGSGAKVLAGGTDLIVNMKKKVLSPSHVVSLSKIPELKEITGSNGTVKIGSCVTAGEICRSRPLIKTFDGRRLKTFVVDAKTAFAELGGVFGALRGLFGDKGLGSEAITGKLKEIGEGIVEGIKTVLDYLIGNAENIDYSKLFDIINKALFGGLLLSLKNLIQGGLLGGILGEDVTEGIADTLEGLGDTLTAYQNNIKADTLQKIATAIAILAGSLFLLTLIDTNKLEMATIAIATMTASLFGGAGALRLVDTKGSIQAALAIIAISVALAIASLALKNISTIDPNDTTRSLEAMTIGLTGLVVAVKGLSAGGGGGASLLKTTGMLIGLSFALLLLSTAIRTYGNMDPDVLSQGLLGISAALTAMTAAVVVITRLGDKGMVSAALGITIMSGALLVLKVAVEQFGNLDTDVLTQGLQSIGIILAGVAVFSRLLDAKGMFSASLGILAMSGALIVMSIAVQRFGDIQWDELLRGLAGLGVTLLLVVIAANLMSGALAGALATMIMSVAILALAGALKLLATLSWEELLIGLAAIAGVFIILGVAGALLTPVVPTLLLLGVAMLLIGAGAALFGLGVMLAATGLVALAGAGVAIGAAIKIVGEAIIEILPRLGAAIAEALVNFITTIAENMPDIIEAFKEIVLGMIGALVELIPEMVAAVFDLLTAILEEIAARLPDLIQAGFDILLAFLQGIEDNIQEVVVTAGNIVVEFIDGIAAVLPDIIDSGFNLLVSFLNGIADAIEEHNQDIIDAGIRIGEAIVDGVVNAINAGLAAIIGAITGIGGAALEAIKSLLGITSPSKEFYKVGNFIIEGFVRGIEDGAKQVRETFKELGRQAQEGISPMVAALNDELSDRVELYPVITPVMDLNNIQTGADKINNAFTNSRVLAELSYEGQLTAEGYSGVNGEQKEVTFIQNNYSPKALDREAIYRQTRTQVARLKVY